MESVRSGGAETLVIMYSVCLSGPQILLAVQEGQITFLLVSMSCIALLGNVLVTSRVVGVWNKTGGL